MKKRNKEREKERERERDAYKEANGDEEGKRGWDEEKGKIKLANSSFEHWPSDAGSFVLSMKRSGSCVLGAMVWSWVTNSAKETKYKDRVLDRMDNWKDFSKLSTLIRNVD